MVVALLSTESTGWGAVVGRAMLAFTHVLLGNYGKNLLRGVLE